MSHPSVSSVLILLQQGDEYLWQRRAADDDDYPGCLDFAAGGGIEPGESCMQAAQRELHEELGVRDLALQAGPVCWLVDEYCALFTGVTPQQVQLGPEVDELLVMSLAAVRQLPSAQLHPQLAAWLQGPESAHLPD